MKIKKARKVLEDFNKWRRDSSSEIPSYKIHTPKDIGIAIDVAVKHLKKKENESK